MKKLLSLFLSLALIAVLGAGAFAAVNYSSGANLLAAKFPTISSDIAVKSSAPGSFSEVTEDSVPVNPIANPSTTKLDSQICGSAEHAHWHTHTSTDTDTEKYLLGVYAFAIEFEDDFWEELDTSDMVCTNGNTKLVDCSFDKDTISEGDVIYNSNADSENTDRWNGTTITYEKLDWAPGSPNGLVWHYGQNDPSDTYLIPFLSSGKTKGESVTFKPSDYASTHTAITKSWTKLEFFWMDPDDYNPGNNDLANMHPLYPTYIDSDPSDGNDDDEIKADPDNDYIFWYGYNRIFETSWPVCEEQFACTSLEWNITDLGVDDLYSTLSLEVTAYNGTEDITDELEYHYEAWDQGSFINIQDPDASGLYKDWGFPAILKIGNDIIGDKKVDYSNVEPGEILRVEAVGWEDDCNATLRFPYCKDLSIDDPGEGFLGTVTDPYSTPIDITVTASNGEEWPFDVYYESDAAGATFNGSTGIYSTTDASGEIVDYYSEDYGQVDVYIDPDTDVAGKCSADFSYIFPLVTIPECQVLTVRTPASPVSIAVMSAGDVEITWDSFMTDGSITLPPWTVWSTNSSGTFEDASGNTGTGRIITNDTTVYYTGVPGDTIYIEWTTDPSNLACSAVIESIPEEEAPYCEDLLFVNDYPYEPRTGTAYDIDVMTERIDMYDESVVCFDWWVNVFDLGSSFSGTLVAEGWEDNTMAAYNGQLRLNVNETGGVNTGNPTSLPLNTGLIEYTGTVCWENFEEDNYLSLYVAGEELLCAQEFEFPPLPPQELYCDNLEMTPDAVTMTASDTDAGTIDVNITYGGNKAAWTGTLIVDSTDAAGGMPGTGDLFYTDGSPSEFADGHLEIPVSGTSGSVDLTYIGGQAGDMVNAYIDGEEDICQDLFRITQEGAPVCYDLSFDVESVVVTEIGENLETTLTLDSDLEGQNVHITYLGCDGKILYEGGEYYGELVIEDIDGDATLNVGFTNICADAIIEAAVEDWGEVCADEIEVTEVPEALVCYDMSFDVDTIKSGSDTTTQLCVDSDLEDQSVHVIYTGCDGTITYNGTDYNGELVIDNVDRDECFDVTFNDVCTDADIEAFIEGWEGVCWDEIEIEEALYCVDLSFDADEVALLEGEDFETELTLTSELENNTVIIEYTGCDESMEVEFDGVGLSGDEQLRIPNIGSGTTTFDVTFNNICADAEINSYTTEAPELCSDEIIAEVLEVGEFSEYIFTFNFIQEQNSYSRENVFFSHDEDRAFYTLEYDPAGPEEDIVFTDDIWERSIEGRLGDGSDSGGEVYLATSYDELTGSSDYTYQDILKFGFGHEQEANSDDLAKTVKDFTSSDYMTFIPYIKFPDGSDRPSKMIDECDGFTDGVCFEPSITPENDGRVLIRNAGKVTDLDEDAVIRIRFVGVVDSTLTRDGCSSVDDDCLTESFKDTSSVEVYEELEPLRAEAQLVVLCSYLVTRNAGDVYLEVNLRGGSDISCIFVEEGEATSDQYRNADALVILDASGGGSTGKEASYCDGDDVGSLSSYICEIISSVSDLWTKSTVESTTESRVSQATRNANTTQALDTYSGDWNELLNDLKNKNNPSSGILYFDGSQSASGNMTISGDLVVLEGAWTIIVENADLVLNGDITYSSSYSNLNNIPSIAFVVLGGDIVINRTAHELSGVFYTNQSFTGEKRDAVDDPLTFYGSVYGHIQPLLDAAKYVGSPNLDGGGIVVRYDSRILLNTPPALSEYVDINTERGVN